MTIKRFTLIRENLYLMNVIRCIATPPLQGTFQNCRHWSRQTVNSDGSRQSHESSSNGTITRLNEEVRTIRGIAGQLASRPPRAYLKQKEDEETLRRVIAGLFKAEAYCQEVHPESRLRPLSAPPLASSSSASRSPGPAAATAARDSSDLQF